jgi:hypothetical protein
MADDDGSGTPASEEKTVPYDRFRKVVAAKNEAASQIESLQAQIQTLTEKAATVDTLAAQIETIKADAAAAESRFSEESALMSAGLLDPSARVVARALHGALGADAPPIAEWLGGMKEKPDDMPPALAAYMQPAGGQQAATKPASTNTRGGVNPSGARQANEPITAEHIRKVREECQRASEAGKPDAWKPYQELRAKM